MTVWEGLFQCNSHFFLSTMLVLVISHWIRRALSAADSLDASYTAESQSLRVKKKYIWLYCMSCI